MAVSQVHVIQREKLICDLCEIKVEFLVSKCVDCDVYMCRNCTKAHTKIKLTSDHRIVSNQHGPIQNSKLKSKCRVHSPEEFIFHCETCELLICPDCILGDHKQHTYVKLKDAAKQKEENISKTVAILKDSYIPKIGSKLEEVQTILKDNEQEGFMSIRSIDRRMNELVVEINKIRDKLKTDSKQLQEQNLQRLLQIQKSLKRGLSEMERLYSDYSGTLNSGSDIEKILADKELSIEIAEFESLDKEVKCHIPKFIPGNTNISSLQQLFGYMDTGSTPDKDNDCYFNEYKQRTDKTAENKTSIFDVTVVSSFKYKSTIVTSICPITDNTALVHCYGEYDNGVLNNNGQIQRTVKLNFIAYDIVMTLGASGIVATDAESTKIYKLTVDGRKTCVISTAPLRPVCLCMSSDGNILVTLYDKWSYEMNVESRRLVGKISANTGQTIERYEYDRGTRLFTLPTGIDENINGDICVVNRTSDDNGHLVILDSKGRLKVTYEGEPMDKQFYPARVTCDKLGHIIVTDWRNKKIHLLSTDGQLVQYLMTERELKQVPYSLASNNQGILWIGCANGQIYTIMYLELGMLKLLSQIKIDKL